MTRQTLVLNVQTGCKLKYIVNNIYSLSYKIEIICYRAKMLNYNSLNKRDETIRSLILDENPNIVESPATICFLA